MNPLGLSIGTTNLVAMREGSPPLIRQSVLTLFRHRAPEVGVSPQTTGEPGLTLTGFVNRVGDPVPLVAADGSTHSADRLLTEALDAITRAAGGAALPSAIAIGTPAHWGRTELDALRAAVGAKPALTPDGTAPRLVSDASAALAGLHADPGLPERGVVALLDFGASGTSITLADADSGCAPIGRTVRYGEFSGDQIDQSVLTHVLADISGARDVDPSSTAAVGSLIRLRELCRIAKEQLSADTVTVLDAEVPGYRADIRLTRAELENLIETPFGGVVAALREVLAANRIPPAALTAVATTGGGASIPLITERLSEHVRVPVIRTAHPQLTAATGAQLIAAARAAVPGLPGAATAAMAGGLAAAAATGTAAAETSTAAVSLTASESPTAGPASAVFPALAWSEEDSAEAMAPYRGGADDYALAGVDARPRMEFVGAEERIAEDDRDPWYRRPQLVLLAAGVALLMTSGGGLAYTLASDSSPLRPGRTAPAAPAGEADAPPTAPAAPAPAGGQPGAPAPQQNRPGSPPAQVAPRPAAPAAPAAPPAVRPSVPPPPAAPPAARDDGGKSQPATDKKDSGQDTGKDAIDNGGKPGADDGGKPGGGKSGGGDDGGKPGGDKPGGDGGGKPGGDKPGDGGGKPGGDKPGGDGGGKPGGGKPGGDGGKPGGDGGKPGGDGGKPGGGKPGGDKPGDDGGKPGGGKPGGDGGKPGGGKPGGDGGGKPGGDKPGDGGGKPGGDKPGGDGGKPGGGDGS